MSVPDVPVRSVQKLLHQNKAKTTYISDVTPNSEYFEAAQWLGLQGYLHDIYLRDTLAMRDTTTYRSLRGTQYAAAYPFHELHPEQSADIVLLNTWMKRLNHPQIKEKITNYYREEKPIIGELLLYIYRALTSDL